MSQLSDFVHKLIDSTTWDDAEKRWWHQWAMLFVWAGIILGPIVLLIVLVAVAR